MSPGGVRLLLSTGFVTGSSHRHVPLDDDCGHCERSEAIR